MPITLLVCGPALPPNPPQDDPAPIPPPQGGGSGTATKKTIWRRNPPEKFLKIGNLPFLCYTFMVSPERGDTMSVLKQKRTTSKAEFINTANQIYVETLNFLTRLSARYSRLIAEPVAKLAGEIIDHAEKANSIFPSDNQRIEMRKAHLLEARASLMALDVRLTHVYLILNQNPEGAFTTSKGNAVKSQDAMEKLDKMAQNLGELIDKENELLKGAIKNVTAKQK